MDRTLMKKILLDCFKLDRIDYERARILTIAHDTDRSLLLADGRAYSPLIDTMEDDLAARGVRCLSIARITSTLKGPLSYGNVHSPEGRFARALVRKRFKDLFIKGKYPVKERYPYEPSEERIWDEILDRTAARYVFGIQPSRELCVACHRRGVWVADVQHGVIAERHPWYGQDYRARDPVEWLPSTFLLWDQGSDDVIRKWSAPKGILPRIIGNRWLSRFMKASPVDTLVTGLLERAAAIRPPGDMRKAILVTLGWDERDIPNGFIIEGLEAVIRKTAEEFRWVIRVHPNQLKGFATHEGPLFFKYFDERLKGYAEWECATTPPLPAVLRQVDMHISWMSSTAIEASQMGIRSAMLSPRLRAGGRFGDYYEYYRARGLVQLVEETEESILGWIRRTLSHSAELEDYEAFDREYESLLDFLAQSGPRVQTI